MKEAKLPPFKNQIPIIYNNVIGTNNIDSSNIDTDKISFNKINTNNIDSNNIDADEISFNNINTNNMNSSDINSNRANFNNINSNNIVSRDKLLKEMGEKEKKVFLVHANIGFGKTMLLSIYAKQTKETCIWYHFSRRDNEKKYFFNCLKNIIYRTISNCTDFIFNKTETNKNWIENEIITLFSELKNQEIAVFLDDFQEMKNEKIIQFFEKLIQYTPSNIRFFFAVRGAFPKFLARYVLQGIAFVYTQEQLSFTKEDILYLLGIQGKENTKLADSLFDFTRGWPAGVIFALQEIKKIKRPILIEEIETINCHSTIFHYIRYELYQKLTFEIQNFLVRSSALLTLHIEVCNAALEIKNSKEILDYLIQENLFIIPENSYQQTYQYHPIFLKFLNHFIKKEEKTKILKRAAIYSLQNKEEERAAEYGILLHEDEIVEQAISLMAEELLNEEKENKLERWINYLLRRQEIMSPKILLLTSKFFYFHKNYIHALTYAEKAESAFYAMGQEKEAIRAIKERTAILIQMGEFESCMNVVKEELKKYKIKDCISELYFIAYECSLFLQKEDMAVQYAKQVLTLQGMNQSSIMREYITGGFLNLIEKLKNQQIHEIDETEILALKTVSSITGEYLQWKVLHDCYFYQKKEILEKLLKLWERKLPEDTIYAKLSKLYLMIFEWKHGRTELLQPLQELIKELEQQNSLVPLLEEDYEILLQQNNKNKKYIIQKNSIDVLLYVNIYCLGGFIVKVGKEEVQWRTNKAKEMAAFLFDRQGDMVRREVIIEALWPEISLDTSNSLFHTTLSYVRKAFIKKGISDIIITKNKTYGINMEKIKSDCAIFLRLYKAINKKQFTILEGKENILKIYRGDYMEGLEYLWCSGKIEYYERLYLKCCEQIAEYDMSQGNYENALYCLKIALEHDPYAEQLIFKMLKCYGALNDYKHAKLLYEKSKQLFLEDLEIDIEEEMEIIYKKCIKKNQ